MGTQNLTRLKMRNFQCWESLNIELSSTITTICGPSDTGKSSIIRGLQWLAFNRPLGETFKRYGADKVSAEILVDGIRIRRQRTKKENSYRIKRKGQSVQEYKALGTDVPDSISSILNLGTENFAGQHDPPFWFSLTPGEVAKELNKIVDLAVIDSATAHVGSLLRKAKSAKDVVEERLEEAGRDRERTEWAIEAQADYDRVARLMADAEVADKRYEGLRDLKVRTDSLLSKVIYVGTAADKGDSVLKEINEWRGLLKQHKGLSRLLEDIEDRKADAVAELPDTSSIDRRIEEAASLRASKARLDIVVMGTLEALRMNCIVSNRLKEAEEELVVALDGNCPLCGNDL